MSATDRLPRLLALVPYLLSRSGIRMAEAAADFDVSETQLRRDLELLWMCGLPGHGPGDLIDLAFDGDTVAVTYDAGMTRPLRLATDEALALLVSLRTLADLPGLPGRDAVLRALSKVESAIGDTAATATAPGISVHLETSEHALTVTGQALRQQRALHLTYYAANKEEISERTVDPMRLTVLDGRWYLEAWCRKAQQVRLFRLDRIDSATLLDQPSAPPGHARSRVLADGPFETGDDYPQVILQLTPAARWIIDYYPCEAVNELPAGDIEVKLRASSLAWAQRLVFRLGKSATVIAPIQLRDDVHTESLAALAEYGAVG